MKKGLLNLTIIALSSITLLAQNEIDALRFSKDVSLGTARFSAMSGAFGSLGGEFSALSLNPGGIGMYQFSEFSFTPSFNLNSTTSYYGNKETDYKSGLKIGNIGLVFSSPRENSEWKRVNFAIGWNQLANYDGNIRIQGKNNTSSIADNILAISQGNSIDELNTLYSAPSFWTDLIDLANNSIDTTTNWYAHDNGNYISNVKGNSSKTQTKNIHSSGGKNEFIFSTGGSFNEQLYLGATIGIPTLDYYEKSTYSETNFEDTINGLKGFDLNEELSVYGAGLNLKLGAILRVNDNLKLGASLHTPTAYSIEETYSTSLTTNFNDTSFTERSNTNYFEYDLITPWKAILSASSLLNNNILLSADYEIVDYSFSNMHSSQYTFTDENTVIQELYTKTSNIRLGVEMNVKPFVLRAGYSKYGSAYVKKDYSQENYSFGLGVNNGGYYFDASYVLSQGNSEHLLYDEEYISPIALANTNHNLIFTLGFRY
ncbi:MAG: hypothetical protein HN522_04465 [Flavobacteriales bacterium]|nr:hypothetical protein [Flavobacteriales bacterium]MBT5750903.1 hypothetical protein [Flavobacteriales bacterium]